MIMVCTACGKERDPGERFCRRCGTDLDHALSPTHVSKVRTASSSSKLTPARDPDELTGNGIGSVIMGDGFLMVAVLLSVTHTAISSLLWLLLLIPAFFFFGKGFADVLHARQIHRREKQRELAAMSSGERQLSPASVVDAFRNYASGELLNSPRGSKRTTHELN